MSTKPLILKGLVNEKTVRDDDGILNEMRRENQRLESELRQVRAELEEKKSQGEISERVIRNLRDQLNPLHRALRAVFGEIELAIGEDGRGDFPAGQVASSSAGTTDVRWQSFKESFPGMPARIIDALLAHSEMSITQLSVLLKAHYTTVQTSCLKLAKAGALVKGGAKGAYKLNR